MKACRPLKVLRVFFFKLDFQKKIQEINLKPALKNMEHIRNPAYEPFIYFLKSVKEIEWDKCRSLWNVFHDVGAEKGKAFIPAQTDGTDGK